MHSRGHCCQKLCIIMPFVIIIVLIAFLLWLYTEFYIIRTLESTVTQWVYGIFYYCLVLLELSHLIRCFLTNPGRVSNEWSNSKMLKVKFKNEGDREEFFNEFPDLRQSYSEIDSSRNAQEYFYCKICKNVKPERCHHCRVCNTCYLRMDHHCPWVGNCVGFRNHKFFFMFLGIGFFDSCVMIGTLALPFGRIFCFSSDIDIAYNGGIMGTMVLSISFAFCTLFMGCLHLSLLFNNLTTVESNSTENSPYSLGSWCANIQQILGKNILLWLLPILPQFEIDGHNYEKIELRS